MNVLKHAEWLRLARNRVQWITLGSIAALIALAALLAPESRSTRKDRASEKTPKPLARASGDSESPEEFDGTKWNLVKDSERLILIRKTLDLPSELNFSQVDLAHALAWLEQTSGILFLIETETSALLEKISVQAKDTPLREILAMILAPNDLALALRGDAALIVPCAVSLTGTPDDDSAPAEMQITLSAAPGEPVEFYTGPRNQRRIRVAARLALAKAAGESPWQAFYEEYDSGLLVSKGFLDCPGGEWGQGSSSLSLRVTAVGADSLAITVKCRFAHGG